jgi:hypothetical protein
MLGKVEMKDLKDTVKLKQASAVLGVPAKDLQNLVQLGVIRPARRNRVCWFDANLLLKAKVAFYLKDLPKGRKRAGWKKDFLRNLQKAAADLGDISEEQILKTVRE